MLKRKNETDRPRGRKVYTAKGDLLTRVTVNGFYGEMITAGDKSFFSCIAGSIGL
ncbi:MAG: hypothetical protein IT279_11330 [Ignavibacteriaceae bacterium]|nr:hypothetical protein [Ignavibacteriaceae bacterium]